MSPVSSAKSRTRRADFLYPRTVSFDVRPNIDIPWSVHGEIKQLVEEGYYDDLDDAYETVLREGLDG